MSAKKDKRKTSAKAKENKEGPPVEKAPMAFQISRQLDQERIGFLSKRIEELIRSNGELRSNASQNEKDTHDIVLYFQREMEIKDEIILRLNEELVKCQTQLKFEVEKARKAFEDELSELRYSSDMKISTLTAQLENAENELKAVEKYRLERYQHEDLIQQLNQSMAQQRDQFVDAMEEQERRFLEEKAQLLKDLDEQKLAFRQVALEEARSLMGEDVKKILADNSRLHEELRFHHAESSDFQAEKNALHADLAAAKREASIFAEKEIEYAKQAYNRTKEIKTLRDRVEFLEKQQALNVEKFRQKAKELKSTVTKELEEATLDAAGLRRLIHIKNKELKHMKALAATILSQRTETEQFFLEALQEVKEVIRQEKKQKAALAAAASPPPGGNAVKTSTRTQAGTLFPPLNIKPAQMHLLENSRPTRLQVPLSELEKISINDLNWEDKELVLRVLFSKMNGVGSKPNKRTVNFSAPAQAVFISEGVDMPSSAVNLTPFEVNDGGQYQMDNEMQRGGRGDSDGDGMEPILPTRSHDVDDYYSQSSTPSKAILPSHQQTDLFLASLGKPANVDDNHSIGSMPSIHSSHSHSSKKKKSREVRTMSSGDDDMSLAGHSMVSSLGSQSRGGL